jgi:hypothetical protein
MAGQAEGRQKSGTTLTSCAYRFPSIARPVMLPARCTAKPM